MKRLLSMAAISLAGLATPAVAATYACVETAASGFDYKGTQWQMTPFLEQKFLLTLDGVIARFNSEAFGQDLFQCTTIWPATSPHIYRCVSGASVLIFNDETLKFTISYNFGEAGNRSDQNYHDSIRIAYGICQSFK